MWFTASWVHVRSADCPLSIPAGYTSVQQTGIVDAVEERSQVRFTEIPDGYKQTALPPDHSSDHIYEVEEILAHRDTEAGKRSFLVKWKDFPYEECSWEPETNVKAPNKVKAYFTSKKRDREGE